MLHHTCYVILIDINSVSIIISINLYIITTLKSLINTYVYCNIVKTGCVAKPKAFLVCKMCPTLNVFNLDIAAAK